MPDPKTLRIVHVTRTPVGGIFRHILDVASGQAARGHNVGIVCDSTTGGARAEAALAAVAPQMKLGVSRFPMQRELGPADVKGFVHVSRHLASLNPDVLHGHGAKGGAYARLCGGPAIRVYTPHGGSLHYSRGSPIGLLYLTLERVLMARTELFLFESRYGRDVFTAKIGSPNALVRVVHNGVTAEEFVEVTPQPDATDIVFIGELRHLKGVNVLLDALALLSREGRTASATVIGAGPDAEEFRRQSKRLGLDPSTRFLDPMAARAGFTLGRLMVAPSRAESLPYIILEAAAAAVPVITTNVGGIPEVFGPQAARLIPPGDAAALARAIAAALADSTALRHETLTLRARVQAEFSAEAMAEQVLAAYHEALRSQRG